MLENLKPRDQRRPCKVRTIADELSEADAEILLAAVMDNKNWKIKTLAVELSKIGIDISEKPITSHRTKVCSCWKI